MTRKSKRKSSEIEEVAAEVGEKDANNYASEAYWDKRYRDNSFEHQWYYTFDLLEPILQSCLENKDLSLTKALEIGCGDRPIVNKFHKLGLDPDNLYGMDFSSVVIDLLQSQLSKLDGKDECKVHYSKADARKMDAFESNEYGLVVDKGTMDAMLSSSSKKTGISNAKRVISEAIRVLARDGSFMLISHIEVDTDEFEVLMDDILLPALMVKEMVDWSIKVHVVQQDDSASKEGHGYGTIYLVTSIPRRETRNSASRKATVTIEVFQYSDGDDNSEDGEEDFNYCQPCTS